MTMLIPCPFCRRFPRMFLADDEFNEIDDRYAYEFASCDPDDKAACKSWLEENIDYIAYYAVVACSCGVQLITNDGATAEELKQDVTRKWNRRKGADLPGM